MDPDEPLVRAKGRQSGAGRVVIMVNETTTGARLVDRWPSAVGLILAAAAIAGIVATKGGVDLTPGVAAMMAIYPATWATGRPMAAFLMFGGTIVVGALAFILKLEGALVMTVVLVAAWLWAIVVGRAQDRYWFTVETVGMIFFGGLTIAAFVVDSNLGVVIAGVGWLTHGLWDAFHYVRNKIVSRNWSELCAVVDIPVGVALIIAGIVR
ncbi:hypothetical protein [Tenggerimyces flavus]|uniref:Uncharacterized protein n=1 Tax=Tenggerimyces flavus TaxID=1708749 RepID=A0ABV7Y380_9ACTN|nr:hypothetical protein [Tenggerimyces flavus]MBM7790882.1 hypothetical protein [Tenggerimyces flavus]